MKKLITPFIVHWRTTLLGLACLAIATWSMTDTWNYTQTVRFHVTHIWPAQIALLAVGIGLLFAADSHAEK